MITFTTDDCLMDSMPPGLAPALCELARDVAEEHVHDAMCTFFLPENAADLADGGPISEPVCCGGSLATAIAAGGFRAIRHDDVIGAGAWAAPVTECGYRADVLLIPDTDWIPEDIRQALIATCRQGEGDD